MYVVPFTVTVSTASSQLASSLVNFSFTSDEKMLSVTSQLGAVLGAVFAAKTGAAAMDRTIAAESTRDAAFFSSFFIGSLPFVSRLSKDVSGCEMVSKS